MASRETMETKRAIDAAKAEILEKVNMVNPSGLANIKILKTSYTGAVSSETALSVKGKGKLHSAVLVGSTNYSGNYIHIEVVVDGVTISKLGFKPSEESVDPCFCGVLNPVYFRTATGSSGQYSYVQIFGIDTEEYFRCGYSPSQEFYDFSPDAQYNTTVNNGTYGLNTAFTLISDPISFEESLEIKVTSTNADRKQTCIVGYSLEE